MPTLRREAVVYRRGLKRKCVAPYARRVCAECGREVSITVKGKPLKHMIDKEPGSPICNSEAVL